MRRIDIASVVGVCLASGALLLGQYLAGGRLGSLLQPTAAVIVFGGTLGATLLSAPGNDIRRALVMLLDVFAHGPARFDDSVESFTHMATVARKDGIVALDAIAEELSDPFFRHAIQHVVDGANEDLIRDVLDTDSSVRLEEDQAALRVFETAGGYAPTIGIIGAVLGLIHAMEFLSEPERLGQGIAVAFVATIYGVGVANLVLFPVAAKLRRLVAVRRRHEELVIEGALALQSGQHPRAVRTRLEAFSNTHTPRGQRL